MVLAIGSLLFGWALGYWMGIARRHRAAAQDAHRIMPMGNGTLSGRFMAVTGICRRQP